MGEDAFRSWAVEVYWLSRQTRRPDFEKRWLKTMSEYLGKIYGVNTDRLMEISIDLDSVKETLKRIISGLDAYHAVKKLNKIYQEYMNKVDDIVKEIILSYLDKIMKEELKAELYTKTFKELVNKYTARYEPIIRNELKLVFCEGVLMYGVSEILVRNYIEKYVKGIRRSIYRDLDEEKYEIIEKLRKSIEEAKKEILIPNNDIREAILKALQYDLGITNEEKIEELKSIIYSENFTLIPVEYVVKTEDELRDILGIFSNYGCNLNVSYKIYIPDQDTYYMLDVEGIYIIIFRNIEDRDKFIEEYLDEKEEYSDMYVIEIYPMSGGKMYLPKNKPYIIEIW